MSKWNFIAVSDQYARFGQLNAGEVKKLLEWTKLQPHLPDISGESRVDPHKACLLNIYANCVCECLCRQITRIDGEAPRHVSAIYFFKASN